MIHVLFVVARTCQRNERYRLSLRAGGFRVVTTEDTTDVPRLLAALRPAVCIIDICSLRARGWGLCEAIRAIPSLKQTALILLAETNRCPRAVLTARSGRFGCTLLPKPLASNDLVDCVATLIALQSAGS